MLITWMLVAGCSSDGGEPCEGESCTNAGSGGASNSSGGQGGDVPSASSSAGQGGQGGQGGGEASAGGGGQVEGCAANPTTGELPCDVGRVLQQRCQGCHNPADLEDTRAPFSLVTYPDTQAPFGSSGEPRWRRMAEVIVPGSKDSMPPNKPLNAADRQVLTDWFAACAPPRADGVTCP